MSIFIPYDSHVKMTKVAEETKNIREAAMDRFTEQLIEIRNHNLTRELHPKSPHENENEIRMDLAIADIMDLIDNNTDGLTVTLHTDHEDKLMVRLDDMGQRYWEAVNS